MRACIAARSAIVREQSTAGSLSREFVEWAERADRYAKPDTIARAQADIGLGMAKVFTDRKSALKLFTEALEIARRLDDRDTIASASVLIGYGGAPKHIADRPELAEELWASRSGIKARGAGLWNISVLRMFLVTGQRKRAEEVLGEMRAVAARTGNVYAAIMSAGMDAVLAVINGRFEDVTDTLERMRAQGEEAGIGPAASSLARYASQRARVYLCAPPEALPVEFMGQPSGSPLTGFESWTLAYMGHREEAAKALEQAVVQRPGIGTTEDETPVWGDIHLLEASVLIGHAEAARLLLHRLAGVGLCGSDYVYPSSIPRQLGGAAALIGRYDQARQHYMEAIRVCTEMRFRPDLALTRLQLAELLLDRYPDEKKDALEHLDFGIKEFREMKMLPFLERALRRKEILKA